MSVLGRLPLPLHRSNALIESEGTGCPRPIFNHHRKRMSLINFKQLYRIDDSNPKKIAWFNGHLGHVFSDRELEELEDLEKSPLIGFKICLSAIFAVASGTTGRKERVMGISHKGEMRLLLFVAGLYMDCSSHSIVADAYCFEVTPEHRASRAHLPANQRLDVKGFEQSEDELKIWRAALPAMIERCRDWGRI